MENFITGYPGCEYQIRQALGEVIGQEKSEFFFDKVRPHVRGRSSVSACPDPCRAQFLEYFFTEEDAKFFKSLGLNCIRIPFNYRHFEGASGHRVCSALRLTDTPYGSQMT